MTSYFSGLARRINLIYLLRKIKAPKSNFSFTVYFVKHPTNTKNQALQEDTCHKEL